MTDLLSAIGSNASVADCILPADEEDPTSTVAMLFNNGPSNAELMARFDQLGCVRDTHTTVCSTPSHTHTACIYVCTVYLGIENTEMSHSCTVMADGTSKYC